MGGIYNGKAGSRKQRERVSLQFLLSALCFLLSLSSPPSSGGVFAAIGRGRSRAGSAAPLKDRALHHIQHGERILLRVLSVSRGRACEIYDFSCFDSARAGRGRASAPPLYSGQFVALPENET